MHYQDLEFMDELRDGELTLRAWNIDGTLLITEDQKDHFDVIFDYEKARPILRDTYNPIEMERTPDGFYKIIEVFEEDEEEI